MANKKAKSCFIIMPVTTPDDLAGNYQNDMDHFTHVLECIFIPALKKVEFEAIPPKATGSEIIQAEIIAQLANSDLVLCDMSILNPNVFFEFGIRTALNKPVALVVDDKTLSVPFDTSILNFHKYKSALNLWETENEINKMAEHISVAFEKGKNLNALWKYFGVSQVGNFKPEESTDKDKLDLILNEIKAIKYQSTQIESASSYGEATIELYINVWTIDSTQRSFLGYIN